MQYFKDLSDNFDDIKKRKFVLTEHTLATPYLSITDDDSLLTILDGQYQHILSKYRLNKEVYTSFFQTIVSGKDKIKFASKDEEGILTGAVLSAKDNLISEAINNAIKSLLVSLSRDKISTYEKTILCNTFCTLGPVYVGVYSLGVEDLLFIFKDETNVFKSVMNSLAEKYRLEFKDYNLKNVLNFYCDRFFKNVQVGNNLSLQKIQQIYLQIVNDFNLGTPIHISDLFYVDLINTAQTNYAKDLVTSYGEGLLQAKNTLGASVIDNDLGKLGNFISKTQKPTLESFIPKEEISAHNINNMGEVTFSYKTFLVADKVNLASKSFRDFLNLISNKIETLTDVTTSVFFRKLFDLDPDRANKLLANFKPLTDTLSIVYQLPFKASVLTKDDTFVIDYPLKNLVTNILEHMKKKCSYEEIYTNSYKSRIIILFEKFLELMEINPITENFIKSKVVEFLFFSKVQELLQKDSYSFRLFLSVLIAFVNANVKEGLLNVIKTTYDKKFFLFRNLDLLNSVLLPLRNGDPSIEFLVKDNSIVVNSYRTSIILTLSVEDLSYLKFNFIISNRTLESLNRFNPTPLSPLPSVIRSKQKGFQDRKTQNYSKKKESSNDSKSESNKPV